MFIVKLLFYLWYWVYTSSPGRILCSVLQRHYRLVCSSQHEFMPNKDQIGWCRTFLSGPDGPAVCRHVSFIEWCSASWDAAESSQGSKVVRCSPGVQLQGNSCKICTVGRVNCSQKHPNMSADDFYYNGDYNGKQAKKQNVLEKNISDGPSANLSPLFNSNVTKVSVRKWSHICTRNIRSDVFGRARNVEITCFACIFQISGFANNATSGCSSAILIPLYNRYFCHITILHCVTPGHIFFWIFSLSPNTRLKAYFSCNYVVWVYSLILHSYNN